MYEERTYRRLVNSKLSKAEIIEEESDLQVLSSNGFESKAYLKEIRKIIADYIAFRPEFQESYDPIKMDQGAHPLIKQMIKASSIAAVGPMASVAGIVSEYVGKEVRRYAEEVIVENGGDIYLDCASEKEILIYAGESILSNKIGINIRKDQMPVGVCTSSGTIGHSVSFGKADAVVVVAKDTALADAMATSICNRICSKEDIDTGIAFGKSVEGIMAVLIIVDNSLGLWGDVELVKKGA